MGDRSYMSIEFGSDPVSEIMAEKIADILGEYGFDAEPEEIKAGAEFVDDEISLMTADEIFGKILALRGGKLWLDYSIPPEITQVGEIPDFFQMIWPVRYAPAGDPPRETTAYLFVRSTEGYTFDIEALKRAALTTTNLRPDGEWIDMGGTLRYLAMSYGHPPAMWAQQEARYEYDGDQHVYVPGVGIHEKDISSSENPSVSSSELLELLDMDREALAEWVEAKTGHTVVTAWQELMKGVRP